MLVGLQGKGMKLKDIPNGMVCLDLVCYLRLLFIFYILYANIFVKCFDLKVSLVLNRILSTKRDFVNCSFDFNGGL